MTYHELVAAISKSAMERKVSASERCCGCGANFSSFGMTKIDAYFESGKHYCNSDCAMDSEVRFAENYEFILLGGE